MVAALDFHRIRHDDYAFMEITARQVYRRGYSRIAALLVKSGVQSNDDARLGALMVTYERLARPTGVKLEWREFADSAECLKLTDSTREWLRKYEPDALIIFQQPGISG
ncbi:MAG: hypothetical protein SFY80_13410 [Verrucomicrobiota bacterium]|nr:hypothetical protein [Verrucomicrobiota bacterium]